MSPQVVTKGLFLISFMGNRGTLTKPLRVVLTDFEFIYHIGYMFMCVCGITCHEFFYSLLVVAPTLFSLFPLIFVCIIIRLWDHVPRVLLQSAGISTHFILSLPSHLSFICSFCLSSRLSVEAFDSFYRCLVIMVVVSTPSRA